MKPNRSWFSCVLAKGDPSVAEIAIFDEIGMWGVTSASFRDALMALGDVKTIRLSINSPGGQCTHGNAIYNMLKRHKAKVHVTIDGIAASMASVIAMAGDTIVMPQNSLMMIHNPSITVSGTAKELEKAKQILDKTLPGLVTAYAERTGLDREEIEDLMDEETWFTPRKLFSFGFADKIEGKASASLAKATFDFSRFKNIPEAVVARLNAEEEDTMTDKAKTAEEQKAEVTQAAETAAANATKAVTDKSKRITALCELAGKKSLALGFINDGKTSEEVMAELKKLRGAKEDDDEDAENADEDDEDEDKPFQKKGSKNLNHRRDAGNRKTAVIDVDKFYARFNGKLKAGKAA